MSARKSSILLESYLSGRVEPVASWGAENIHIFVVASLALVLAAPAPGWPRRIYRAIVGAAVVSAYSLALTLVQIETVAERAATGTFELTLTTHAEKVFLNWANRGLMKTYLGDRDGGRPRPECSYRVQYLIV